jgi:hypothetical protein
MDDSSEHPLGVPALWVIALAKEASRKDVLRVKSLARRCCDCTLAETGMAVYPEKLLRCVCRLRPVEDITKYLLASTR